MANTKLFTKSMGTQHKTDIAQGNTHWLDSSVQDAVLFSMFLINSFQDLCELQNRCSKLYRAPVIYILLNKGKNFLFICNQHSFVSKHLMREDGSAHLQIHHLLHITEYPIMPILPKKWLAQSVGSQTELTISWCTQNTNLGAPDNQNSVW